MLPEKGVSSEVGRPRVYPRYPDEKICARCRYWFPSTKQFFRPRKRLSKDGKGYYHHLESYCKACDRILATARQAKRRAAGLAPIDTKYRREYRARHRVLHRERIRAYDRSYYWNVRRAKRGLVGQRPDSGSEDRVGVQSLREV